MFHAWRIHHGEVVVFARVYLLGAIYTKKLFKSLFDKKTKDKRVFKSADHGF